MAHRTQYPTGVSQAEITNTTTTMPTSSTDVDLVAPSEHITVTNNGTTQILYVDLANGTATTADFAVLPGTPLVYDGPPIKQFKVIASANTSTFSVLAY